MARILADTPSVGIVIAGFLIIDSPYHIAESKLSVATSKCKLDGIPDLVLKSLDNCSDMLKDWDLPEWDGSLDCGEKIKVRADGQTFTLQSGVVLYKPLKESWKLIDTRTYHHTTAQKHAVLLPLGVMIRCTRPMEREERSGPEPVLIDIYRDQTLLGWEGTYPDFLKAIIDVDDDHYGIFTAGDNQKVFHVHPNSK